MTKLETKGACECGTIGYQVSGQPLFRAICHCTTCQEYNQADYADIIVFRSSDVKLADADKIEFKYHQMPPILHRGKCSSCSSAAIENMNIPFIPKLTILPAQTLNSEITFPTPKFHMFYHRRKSDVNDDLSKHSGYLASQFSFSSALLSALWKKG